MEIKLIVPEGEPINEYSSLEIIEELDNEFDDFYKSLESMPKVNKTIKRTPKDAGGLPEITIWLWENFQELWQDEEFRNLFYQLIKSLAFKTVSLFGRKEKRETKHRVEVKAKNKKLNLPNTQSEVEKFINDLNS